MRVYRPNLIRFAPIVSLPKFTYLFSGQLVTESKKRYFSVLKDYRPYVKSIFG